ncbi:MAG: proline--tRNA ligase [Candidatus Methylarchaceae archaeon HK01B]|nr:proline--tRNA ligase [Candidatus Methylarchaceae archaeon HK01B]
MSLQNKSDNFSEWFDRVLQKAELVDIRYNVKGFIVYRPNIMFIVRRVYEIFEELLMKKNHKPALFPLVIPISNFRKESQHIKGFEEEVFKISEAGGEKLEEALFLRPTSETAIYPMFALWIRSYKDLPMRIFQSVAVYRHETKATRPLLRGREFLWIESHCAFVDEGEARKQVEEDLEITKKTFRELGLPFLMVEREPYDRFHGAVDSYAFDTLLPDGRALQVATTHYLGQSFSNLNVFDIKFTDKDGSKKNVHQTCFGPGVSRIVAAIISIHGDEYGLVLPFDAAPTQVVTIPIIKSGKEDAIMEKSRIITQNLSKAGFRSMLDDSEKRPGEKYYKWEMLGVPIRIEIGEEEVDGDFVTLFRRDLRARERVKDGKVVKRVSELKTLVLEELGRRAWEIFNSSIISINSKEELFKNNEKVKIVRVSFCGRKECADEIKAEIEGMEVRGKRMDIEEKTSGKCFWCGREAVRIVYLAKAY